MNKIIICYEESKGKLNILSRSDEGRLKKLNYRNEFVLVTEEKEIDDLMFISEMYAKSKKEKMNIEREYVDAITTIGKETLDLLILETVERVIHGQPARTNVIDSFKEFITYKTNNALLESLNNEKSTLKIGEFEVTIKQLD